VSFKSSLYTYLSSKTEISSLVSSRIYDRIAPEKVTTPFITFQIISGDKANHTGGASQDASKLVQLHVVGDSGKICETVSEALRNVLDGFIGDMGGMYVTSCFFHNETDDYDTPESGTQLGRFALILDYSIWYNEAIPTL
jgi:hypothetical protein